ncbi:hypothetical protein GCM10008997_24260 [Halomonas salifodinae]
MGVSLKLDVFYSQANHDILIGFSYFKKGDTGRLGSRKKAVQHSQTPLLAQFPGRQAPQKISTNR